MLSIAEKSFLFPLWTIIGFELGCSTMAIAASRLERNKTRQVEITIIPIGYPPLNPFEAAT